MARKKKGHAHEEEMSEAWLLPYSDLMTLLLALFIALFAISQTDQTKMVLLAQAFTSAFNMGGPSFFDQAGPNPSRQREFMSSEDQGNAAFIQENQALEDIQRQLEEYIRQNNLEDQLSTQLEEEGLMIRIKEKALFPSGSADLVPIVGVGTGARFDQRSHRHRSDQYGAIPIELGVVVDARVDVYEIFAVNQFRSESGEIFGDRLRRVSTARLERHAGRQADQSPRRNSDREEFAFQSE